MLTIRPTGTFVIVLLILPSFMSRADTIVQDSGNDYVWFQAGQYEELSNPGTSLVFDNGDGTLSTTDAGDFSSLATYSIQFVHSGDYFLYFRMENVGNDSVFVNHSTGFNSVPGNSDPERWNGLDTGWNGLFDILGVQSNYEVPAGDPAWGWNVSAPSTVSFTVRGRESGVLWQDFVFSQRNDLTEQELFDIIGIAPPPVVNFEYTQTDKDAGFGTLSGVIDGISFHGEMPNPVVTQNDNEGLQLPEGMVGYMNGWSESQPGNPFGVHLGWSGNVTLRGEKQVSPTEVEFYELDVPLVFAADGTPTATWYFETDLTDDGGNGNDAFGTSLRLAGWYGDPMAGHRRSAGAFGDFIEGEIDTRTVSATSDDPGGNAFGDNLGIAISLRNANDTAGPAWLEDDGSGVIYVDRIFWTGGLAADPSAIRLVNTGLVGDFNRNGALDSEDLDLQAIAITEGENPPEFDLNGDGIVDYEGDRIMWLHELKKTYVGDTDLDHEYNTQDFVIVFQAGKYETGQTANWDEGDWDGSRLFDTGDFVAAFTDGGYEQGRYPGAPQGVLAVPEPSSLLLTVLGLAALLGLSTQRKSLCGEICR